jgi:DNA polymerase V
MTNAYAQGNQYFNQLTAELPYLSAYLPEIQATANELVKKIFRPNYKYRKVMIGLTGLSNDKNPQLDLFGIQDNLKTKNEPLMQAFDTINNRYGRGTIKLACGLAGKQKETETAMPDKKPWEMRRNYLSPSYTTNIKEIPIAL